jgi:hypothetical protein
MALPSRKSIAAALTLMFLTQAGLVNAEDSLRLSKGTTVRLELTSSLSTASAKKGERMPIRIASEIRLGNTLIASEGTPGTAIVTKVQRPSALKRAELHIRLEEIQLPSGVRLKVQSNVMKLGSDSEAARVSKGAHAAIGMAVVSAGAGGLMGSQLCIPSSPLGRCAGPRASRAAGITGVAIGAAGAIAAVKSAPPGPEFLLPDGTVLEAKLERAVDIPRSGNSN